MLEKSKFYVILAISKTIKKRFPFSIKLITIIDVIAIAKVIKPKILKT